MLVPSVSQVLCVLRLEPKKKKERNKKIKTALLKSSA